MLFYADNCIFYFVEIKYRNKSKMKGLQIEDLDNKKGGLKSPPFIMLIFGSNLKSVDE